MIKTPLHEQANGPTSGGYIISISGIEFSGQLGHADYTLKSGVSGGAGGTQAEASRWVSDTALISLDGAGVGSTGPICVSVGQQCGTLTEAWTFDEPVASAVRPINQGSQQRSLTVFGFDFGGAMLAHSAGAGVGETACEMSTWISQSALICKAASYLQESNYIYVTVCDSHGSLTEVYSFNTPKLFLPRRRNGPFSGALSATIHGVFFGSLDISDGLRVGSTSSEASGWRSDSSVRAKVSYGLQSTIECYLTANVNPGTVSQSFSYDRLLASSVDPANALVNSMEISIFGHGFSHSSRLRFGRSSCSPTVWTSASQISCRLSAGFIRTQFLLATAGLRTRTLSEVFSYDSAVVTGLAWSYWIETFQILLLFQRFNLPTYPAGPQLSLYRDSSLLGPSIFLIGDNFLYVGYSVQAKLSSSACESTRWASNSLVRCRVASGVTESRTAILTAGSAEIGSSSSRFSYDIPHISDSRVMNGPSIAGIFRITVRGANMGIVSFSANERGGQSACENTLWSSSSSISGRPASGIPGVSVGGNPEGETFKATVGVQVGSRFGAFTYDRPVLSVFPANHPTTGSVSILMLVSFWTIFFFDF
jgi:hypothetical protein